MATVSGGNVIVSSQLLNQSADETYGPWVNVLGCANVTFYVTATGTTSSGVITFEETAPLDPSIVPLVPSAPQDVGKYASITTLNASVVSGGDQTAVHCPSAAYCFVRARISTVIGGGGTISVGLVAY